MLTYVSYLEIAISWGYPRQPLFSKQPKKVCAHLGQLPPGLPWVGQENHLISHKRGTDPFHICDCSEFPPSWPNEWDKGHSRPLFVPQQLLAISNIPPFSHPVTQETPLSKLTCSYSKGALPWPTRCSLVVTNYHHSCSRTIPVPHANTEKCQPQNFLLLPMRTQNRKAWWLCVTDDAF